MNRYIKEKRLSDIMKLAKEREGHLRAKPRRENLAIDAEVKLCRLLNLETITALVSVYRGVRHSTKETQLNIDTDLLTKLISSHKLLQDVAGEVDAN